jgi:hypothetical protein
MMRKLVFIASLIMLPFIFQSTSAEAACLIAGRVFSGRCPDHVASRGYDGRMYWRRNHVYCMRYGRFSHWGHCR